MFVLDTNHVIITQRRSEREWGVLRNRMERYDREMFLTPKVLNSKAQGRRAAAHPG
jgi:hypothetical protein